MKQAYLLTGRPGTGKTSLLKPVAAQMKGKAGGFYTVTRDNYHLVIAELLHWLEATKSLKL